MSSPLWPIKAHLSMKNFQYFFKVWNIFTWAIAGLFITIFLGLSWLVYSDWSGYDFFSICESQWTTKYWILDQSINISQCYLHFPASSSEILLISIPHPLLGKILIKDYQIVLQKILKPEITSSMLVILPPRNAAPLDILNTSPLGDLSFRSN